MFKRTHRANKFKRVIRWTIAIFCLALALNVDALSPTDEQRAIFVRAMSPSTTTEAVNAATSLGRDLGIKQDLFALDYLITSNYVRYVEAFGVGWRQFQDSKKEIKIGATREYESRIAKHFDNGEIVAALLRGINIYESPELFELFYKDAIKLAAHRANRRQHCRAQITQILPAPPESLDAHNVRVRVPLSSKPGYEFRIQDLESNDWLIWRYKCGPMTTDDPRSDLDGKPLVGAGNGQRELKSISAIGRTNLPGIEARLAKLFLNLSLMPRSDWSLVGGRPEYLRLPSWAFERYGHRVTHFASWFTERGSSPPATDVLAILKELESNGMATALSPEDSGLVQFLLQLLPKPQTRAETEFFATWIERLLANEDAKIRQGHITKLLPLLGGVPPSAQIDLTRLKRKAFERVPYDQVTAITDLFKRIEEDNLSLSKPDADSLARAMFYQTAEKMVPAILAAGVNPNEISPKYGDPALVLAARRQEKLIPFLLSNGANVNVHDKSGTTALHLVSGHSTGQPERAELVALLISRGADVNAVTNIGTSPLHMASDSPKTIKLLLAAGASVDTIDSMGRTPLYGTVISGNLDAAKILLEAGANPNREDSQGQSPYTDTLSRQQPQMTALLAMHGGRSSLVEDAKRAAAKVIVPILLSPMGRGH